ncbi:adaptin ear-binding coat-associated protein 1 isoform X2 [Octopus bimaculoides]|uniref:NECAP PHear domain-containing protein n=1 Tax=Octopus bimaculoides TaxID=37653 RepID=A0A0L8HQ37_OCTBM|nr:adaptin ear-binding coat-associated protein 1 isoform X2 [Octopus bimaculoides]|eukprot:XP_014770766.1 PREDICTED: adaptin ear-binding coat-associated protein 1-like isoform X2 [Octopus bimaculoides]
MKCWCKRPHYQFNMAGEYESVICVKNEVFVFRIPPRSSNRGYRASDWKLDAPDWTGRLRVTYKGKELTLKLEDKVSGEEFAKCPVDAYPGVAIEPVMDSSRYFVIRIKEAERSAFIGIGFTDRSDSFDLNVALQDHFKWLKQEQEMEKMSKDLSSAPKLDLSLKEGQTMKLNIGVKRNESGTKQRSKGPGTAGGLLPPPPGPNIKIMPSSGSQQISSSTNHTKATAIQGSHENIPNNKPSSVTAIEDLLCDLGTNNKFATDASTSRTDSSNKIISPLYNASGASNNTLVDSSWGDFTSSHSSASNWVQF